MQEILEAFWYGNICPSSDCFEKTKEKEELMDYIARHHGDLYKTLTKEQKELWEKFDDCHAELADIREREIFVYAFRLGARMAIETMQF